jgi:hypothetical protein
LFIASVYVVYYQGVFFFSFLGPRPLESKILGRFLPKTHAVPTAQAQPTKKKADQVAAAAGDRIQTGPRVAELMLAAIKI